jgi:hypothetical protein
MDMPPPYQKMSFHSETHHPHIYPTQAAVAHYRLAVLRIHFSDQMALIGRFAPNVRAVIKCGRVSQVVFHGPCAAPFASCGHIAPAQRCTPRQESLAAVYAFVRDMLADPASEFYLFTTPPRQVMPDDAQKNLKLAGLVPSAVVYIGRSCAACSGATKKKTEGKLAR